MIACLGQNVAPLGQLVRLARGLDCHIQDFDLLRRFQHLDGQLEVLPGVDLDLASMAASISATRASTLASSAYYDARIACKLLSLVAAASVLNLFSCD
ncbi:hypothetical protein Q2T94_03895 [Paeniglutamicibacter sulfureus]|uniref:hypothetical protein n=1 Tax=Paeniglutamicibacter sulfureus TaxID=43666 RepID=UPI0026652D01|nr:hypothetical protein [Paeniglutamicibacter sulfureus]MDO2933451.1 hypothetical protein [Paeniglutamicibacter sulfureus]